MTAAPLTRPERTERQIATILAIVDDGVHTELEELLTQLDPIIDTLRSLVDEIPDTMHRVEEHLAPVEDLYERDTIRRAVLCTAVDEACDIIRAFVDVGNEPDPCNDVQVYGMLVDRDYRRGAR